MDFISGLPYFKRKDSIMLVVDHLTKYAHFISLSYPFTAMDIAQLFLRKIIRLHGFPKVIISD